MSLEPHRSRLRLIPPFTQVTILQIDNYSVCAFSLGGTSSTLDLYGRILLIVLGATLLVLTVFQTVKQSVAMYKATKKWQPNRYMQQLVRDGALYFIVYVFPPLSHFHSSPSGSPVDLVLEYSQTNKLTIQMFSLDTFRAMFFNITSMVQIQPTGNNGLALFLSLLAYITMCPIMPRFIISVRELYDRDLRGRVEGIDTGFGVLSQPIASENAVVSAIAFADVVPGEDQVVEGDENELEAVRLETRRGQV